MILADSLLGANWPGSEKAVNPLRLRWTVFSHVIRGRPGRLFQFSGGGAVRIILASASSSIRALCPNMERRRDDSVAIQIILFAAV